MTSTTSRCLSCTRGWLHCHETWVVHEDGSTECTSLECAVTQEGHDLATPCREVDRTCCP